MIKINSMLNDKQYDELYGGLIRSSQRESVLHYLQKHTNKKLHINKAHRNPQGFAFSFTDNKITLKQFGEMLDTIVNHYRWKLIKFKHHLSNIEYTNWGDYISNAHVTDDTIHTVMVHIEPIHPVLLDKISYPKNLYYVSPTQFKEKILKKGLIPRAINSQFKYNDRVHYTDNITSDFYKHLPMVLSNASGIIEWTLYTITTKFLPSNFYLFVDEILDNSYFSNDNIPPNLIRQVEDFEI